MSRILIIYGTTDGQTRKIARALGSELVRLGHSYDIFDCEAVDPSVNPHDYGIVIVGASVRYNKYQRSLRSWVDRNALLLNELPSYFFSVCLGATRGDPQSEQQQQKIVDEFLSETGWNPYDWKIFSGALQYTQYGFFVRWMMKRIMERAGGDTDTSRDYEYTNWDRVREYAHEIAAKSRKSEISA